MQIISLKTVVLHKTGIAVPCSSSSTLAILHEYSLCHIKLVPTLVKIIHMVYISGISIHLPYQEVKCNIPQCKGYNDLHFDILQVLYRARLDFLYTLKTILPVIPTKINVELEVEVTLN